MIRYILTTQAKKTTQGSNIYKPLNFMSPLFLCNNEGEIKFGVLKILEWLQKDGFGGGCNFIVLLLLE